MRPDNRLSARAPGSAGAATAAVIATWLALLLLRSPANFFAMAPFGLAVALSALWGGFGPGITAAILSLVASDLLLIGPGSMLTFGSPAQAFAWGAHGLAWVAFCVITRRVQGLAALAKARCSDAERAALQADRLAQLIAALSQARTSAG